MMKKVLLAAVAVGTLATGAQANDLSRNVTYINALRLTMGLDEVGSRGLWWGSYLQMKNAYLNYGASERAAGQSEGYVAGYDAGNTAGQATGYTLGHAAGTTEGYNSGYSAGEDAGFDDAQTKAENAVYNLSMGTITVDEGDEYGVAAKGWSNVTDGTFNTAWNGSTEYYDNANGWLGSRYGRTVSTTASARYDGTTYTFTEQAQTTTTAFMTWQGVVVNPWTDAQLIDKATDKAVDKLVNKIAEVAYDDGYNDGYKDGYADGWDDAVAAGYSAVQAITAD